MYCIYRRAQPRSLPAAWHSVKDLVLVLKSINCWHCSEISQGLHAFSSLSSQLHIHHSAIWSGIISLLVPRVIGPVHDPNLSFATIGPSTWNVISLSLLWCATIFLCLFFRYSLCRSSRTGRATIDLHSRVGHGKNISLGQ